MSQKYARLYAMGAFNSNITTKFVQLLYCIFYHKIVGGQKILCHRLSESWRGHVPTEAQSLLPATKYLTTN